MPDTARRRAATTKTVGDEVTQAIEQSGESLDHIARETMSCCSDTLSAAVQSGTRATQYAAELSRSYLDACAGAATTFAELAGDSLACRTPADIAALQKKSSEAAGKIFEANIALMSNLYGAWSKTFEPVVARAADAPERLFRAMAD